MTAAWPTRLDPPFDIGRDHVLGSAGAEMTLVEYGSYACPSCHAAHEVIANLRDRFGDRMRYAFRHRPITDSAEAQYAAVLAEYAQETKGRFWLLHDVLMQRGPIFGPGDLEQIAVQFGVSPPEENASAWRAAEDRVRQDRESAERSGARVTPTFYINGRRYEGPWDESALAEAMLGSLGHRLHTATVDFVRWAPSTGALLLLMSILAAVLVNSPLGPAFEAWWRLPAGIHFGGGAYTLPLVEWINDGLLGIFFLVVGLEIKRELTVGRLSTRRAAALPLAASIGGMIAPALIYLALVPAGPLAAGWAVPISTDTAFAIALMVVLGDRVPVELRVFLSAAVIIDDLAAIAIVALFYSGAIDMDYLAASVAITAGLMALNHWGVYRALPYAVLGAALWVCVHGAGLHATLAGVILAVVTPTRPPANLRALMAQAETVIRAETRRVGEAVMRHRPSDAVLETLDVVHDRLESPASKLLRSIQPWSSYAVLPIFALANAGVIWSSDVFGSHGRLMLAIMLGLLVGKPIGIVTGAWVAVRLRVAVKPAEYTWFQMWGAGAMAGIGFTMSLFIAGQAYPDEADFAAAKIAIFAASLIAGVAGMLMLMRASHSRSH